jgi:hypothetical protein
MLIEGEIGGPGGPESVYFSNREYEPDVGPNVGVKYLASIGQDIVGNTLAKEGMTSPHPQLRTTIGVASYKPFDLTVLNRQPDPEVATRELDYLFVPGDYTFIGSASMRLAYEKDDNSPPDWADFGDPVATWRIMDPPEKSRDGTTVKWTFHPNSSQLETPLLTERFTGMGLWAENLDFSSGFGIDSGFQDGTDWSVQFYVGVDPPTAPIPGAFYSILETRNASILPVFRLYRNDNTLRVRVNYADSAPNTTEGLFDDYDILDMTGLFRQDLLWITVVWDETNGDLIVYLEDDEIVNTPILNSMARGAAVSATGMPSGQSQQFRFSSARFYTKALTVSDVVATTGVINYGDETSPVADLLHAWEYERGDGFTIVDYVSGSDQSYGVLWGTSLDGEPSQANKVIPGAWGDCYNVELLDLSSRLGVAMAGVGTSEVLNTYSQGVALQEDYSPGSAAYSFDGVADTIRGIPPSITDFGARFVDGQQITVESGTYAGDWEIDDITPSQYRRLRESGSTLFDFTVLLEDLTPNSSGAEVVTISTDSTQADWETQSTENPYGGPDGELISFGAPRPRPVTSDIVGDGEIFVTNPPGTGYVSPGVLGNVILSMTKKYGAELTDVATVDYDDIPDRVGIVVADESSVVENVNKLCRGCLVWVEEYGDGSLNPKPFKFPSELSPSYNLTQGSVISVERVKKVSANGRTSTLTGFNMLYSKAWQTIDRASIPEYAEQENRDFMSAEWRQETIGTLPNTTDVPALETFEVSKSAALEKGADILTISQADTYKVAYRWPFVDALKNLVLGIRIDGDFPEYGLPNFEAILTGIAPALLEDIVTLNLLILTGE